MAPESSLNEALVVNVLRDVMDPELHMDIWTLGLIYGVEIEVKNYFGHLN